MADYDLLGNIAIIKSERNGKKKTKKEKLGEAREILQRPSVKTVLEKSTHVKGRLRKIQTRFIAGEKDKVALYRENNCVFTFNIDECYFSPRLAHDRKEIAEKIKKTDSVLCLFSGVGAYPIVINKIARPRRIVAVEISKACCRYFTENLALNKISSEDIAIIQGDVKKKIDSGFVKKQGKFDVIVMTRPNLKESFLKTALLVAKKNTRIFYHAFCHADDIDMVVEDLLEEAKRLKKNISIKKITPVGNIAPYKYRYRIEMIIR
ncbi:MAG: hypothetical protein RL557_968 [archaeon]|jgi:tRNA (guanine37-N1)-methyltransferase